ncbi:ThuA domain-containing protein [Rosistilla oblonga]|uniref:ThuA domain-containing protein n=1 Tax=Rosistilla oblonga TaxID=2527990 RepID=UPI003A9740AE
MSWIRRVLVLFTLLGFVGVGRSTLAADPLSLSLRYRTQTDQDSGLFHTLHRDAAWNPKETAIILCDMWDVHSSQNAVRREKQIAPRLQQVVEKLRSEGVTVIHSPSGCMDFYADHEARKRAIDAPKASNLPKEINAWCYKIPEEEAGVYPIDQSDGGRDDDPVEYEAWVKELTAKGLKPLSPWSRQIDVLKIDEGRDIISDSGTEIWNVMEAAGIKNVILAGVHTNMCVLGRPFGLRQMVRNGKNAVLIRDLTDTMYNPASEPKVSHFTGTDLIVEHIEKFVCPTITSDQIIGGSEFRYDEDDRPHVVMLVAEREYATDKSLLAYSVKPLGKSYRVSFVYADAEDKNDLRGSEVIESADLLFVSVRRRTLKTEQLERVRAHIAAGKPVVGIRTASHAFHVRNVDPAEGYSQWTTFDPDVFGGNYTGHHGNKLLPQVTFAAITHPILEDVDRMPYVSGGSLYKVSPLASGTTVLMTGKYEGLPAEPLAWTFTRADGGRSFYTSLGHSSDFEQPGFRVMLENAIGWALNRPAAPKATAKP